MRKKFEDSILKISNQSKVDLSDRSAQICALLDSNPDINFLSLKAVTDWGAQAIAMALTTNETLKDLYIDCEGLHRDFKIGDKAAVAFGEALASNQHLKELSISGGRIGDQGAEALAKALIINRYLTGLFVNNNEICAKGGIALGNALAKNQTLTDLYLHNNNIMKDGVKAFAVGLESNRSLRCLGLCNNGFSLTEFLPLQSAIRRNEYLRVYRGNFQSNAEIILRINERKRVSTLVFFILMIQQGQLSPHSLPTPELGKKVPSGIITMILRFAYSHCRPTQKYANNLIAKIGIFMTERPTSESKMQPLLIERRSAVKK